MSELGEQTPAEVYNDLFNLNNANQGLDGTLRAIQSGNGEDTKIKVSLTQVEVDHAGGKSIKPEIKAGRYTYYSNTGVGGSSYAVDLTAGNIQKIALSSTLTNLSFTGAPSSGVVGWIRLIIERSTFTITNWPSGTKWQSGTALDLTSTTNSTTTIVEFMTIDEGSTWYAETVATSMA